MKKCVKLYGLLLLSLFIVGCNNTKEEVKENNEEVKEVKEVPKEELSVELKNKLKDKIDKYNKSLSYLYPVDNITDKLSNQALIGFAMSIYDATHNSDKFLSGYKVSSLDNIVYEYFDNDIKINHEDYYCPYEDNVVYFKYDSNKEKYVYNQKHLGHGYSAIADIRTYILDGYKQGDDVVVNTNLLYSNYVEIGGIDSYYASFEDSGQGKNAVVKLKCDGEDFECAEIKQSDYEKVKDKLPITTFNFKIENDKYVLKSIQINKVD